MDQYYLVAILHEVLRRPPERCLARRGVIHPDPDHSLLPHLSLSPARRKSYRRAWRFLKALVTGCWARGHIYRGTLDKATQSFIPPQIFYA